jgi:hypothetical protein
MDPPPYRRTQPAGCLAHRISAPDDLDECRALDAPNQDYSLACERRPLVRCAGIEVGRWMPQEYGSADRTAGPPLADARRQQRSRDRQPDPAANADDLPLPVCAGAVTLDRADVELQRCP